MNASIIGPGTWVRCINALPASEMREGSVYKVLSVHKMPNRCNGPPNHTCNNVALVLAGITDPCCSTCFAPVMPQGVALLNPLLGMQIPKNQGRRS